MSNTTNQSDRDLAVSMMKDNFALVVDNNKTVEPEILPDFLKIDLTIFIKTILYSIPLFILFMGLGAYGARRVVKQRWNAHATIIRHIQDTNQNLQLPYLVGQQKLDTLVDTIKTRDNLTQVRDMLSLNLSVKQLIADTQIEQDSSKNIFKIHVVANKREDAADIANTLSQVFIVSYTKKQNDKLQRSVVHYQAMANTFLNAIDAVESEIISFNKQYGITSIESEIQSKYRQIENLELQKLHKEMEIMLIQDSDNQKLQELIRQKEWLMRKYTSDNSDLVEITEDIKFLQSKIRSRKRKSIAADPNYKFQVDAINKQIGIIESLIDETSKQLERLGELNKEFQVLKKKLKSEQEKLATVELMLTQAEGLLRANIREFEIVEEAIHAKAPSPSGKIILLAGGILGFIIAFVLVVALEFFNFNLKSKYDFENILKIKRFVKLPKVNVKRLEKKKKLVPFYSYLHPVMGYMEDTLSSKVKVITLGSDKAKRGKSFLAKIIIKLLLSQNKKILYINSLSETKDKSNSKNSLTVNDYLYENGKMKNKKFTATQLSPKLHASTFIMNEQIYSSFVTREQIRNFFQHEPGYDYIIWEVFEPKINPQLFLNIVSASDVFLLTTRFRKTSRKAAKQMVEDLKEKNFYNIVGVLNCVSKAYF